MADHDEQNLVSFFCWNRILFCQRMQYQIWKIFHSGAVIEYKELFFYVSTPEVLFFIPLSLISHMVQVYRIYIHINIWISPPTYNLLPLEVHSSRFVSHYPSEKEYGTDSKRCIHPSLLHYRPASFSLRRRRTSFPLYQSSFIPLILMRISQPFGLKLQL